MVKKLRKMTPEETAVLVKELKERMKEIKKLKKALGVKKLGGKASPVKTKSILEEIKVPSLKALKEKEAKE